MILLLLFLQGFTVFLPVHGHSAPVGKGVAGAAPVDVVGASWYHHWSPCYGEDLRCVDAFKNDYSQPWTNEQAIRQTLRSCRSGYLLLMNEPVLDGLSLDWQVETVRWFDWMRHQENPSCKLVCCGTLAYAPQIGYDGYNWIRDFSRAYRKEYRVKPPLDGIHFHAYKFNENHVPDAMAYIQQVERYYPDAEIWLTEYGSLVRRDWAFDAIRDLAVIGPSVDRYAFFVSYDPGYEGFTLFDRDDQLTDLGKAYCEQDNTCWVFGGD